jgi:hypothetical protein
MTVDARRGVQCSARVATAPSSPHRAERIASGTSVVAMIVKEATVEYHIFVTQ